MPQQQQIDAFETSITMMLRSFLLLAILQSTSSFSVDSGLPRARTELTASRAQEEESSVSSRRSFLSTGAALATTLVTLGSSEPAQAVGPVKIPIEPISYSAAPCPPSRPVRSTMQKL